MKLTLDDTIAAIASAPGSAARGIVRVSGPAAMTIVTRCCCTLDVPLESLSQATRVDTEFLLPLFERGLPVQLLVWPDHRSYTGQPSVELHLLGSPPLLQAVLDQLGQHGSRPAMPGEFTLRAMLNGRLDLTQAEAVLGVIHARGQHELRTALDQLAGGVGAPLRALREALLDALAHLEAGLDFVEEDIEFVTRDQLRQQLSAARAGVEQLARRLDERTTHIDRPRVVLVGEPNVGKSSLFNALAGQPQAIVSDQAGTTRDYLSAVIDCDGLDCELIDTAGLDVAATDLDHTTQRLARQQHAQADLQLWCLDASRSIDSLWSTTDALPTERELPQITVLTKCDQAVRAVVDDSTIATSSRTGFGLPELRNAICRQLGKRTMNDAPVVATTAARCRDAVRRASEALDEALARVDQPGGEELIAAEMRLALEAIGEIVGAVMTDDILDRIFSRFCIGK